MVIICVSLLTLMSVLPMLNSLELTDEYVKWAEGRVTGRPCGQGVQCDLRHQYCDIVMETCRPCTELCRTWDAPEDMDICNKHCAVFLGYHVGVRETAKSTSHHHKTLTNNNNDVTAKNNDLQTLCTSSSTSATVSSVHILTIVVILVVVGVVCVTCSVFIVVKLRSHGRGIKHINNSMGVMRKEIDGLSTLKQPSPSLCQHVAGQKPRSFPSQSATLTSMTSQPPPYGTNDISKHDHAHDVRSYNRDYSMSLTSSSANGSESPVMQPLLSSSTLPKESV